MPDDDEVTAFVWHPPMSMAMLSPRDVCQAPMLAWGAADARGGI